MAVPDPRSDTPAATSDGDRGLTRRGLFAGALGAAAIAGLGCARAGTTAPAAGAAIQPAADWRVANGRIRQSVVGWCFKPMDIPTLARASAGMGLQSVELVDPKHWPLLKELGLVCAISGSHGFVRGLNHVEDHDFCIAALTKSIDATAAAGWPNVITFSGMRKGLSDEEGIRNCVTGIKRIIGHAEKQKVTICMEVLNSRVDVEMKGHPDYHADRIEWAVEVCKQVGSPRMKVLFDIYHTQIMQGDVITRIRQFKDHIGHYHTAGVPGRGEIDDTQEVNYPPIMRAILETGYTGFVGQEFIPTRPDPIASLRQAAAICDV